MNAPLIFDFTLAAMIIAIGGWILSARNESSAVVGFIVYGLMLTMAWVRLSATDVALTEAAIGSGMTGMLLLGAAARLQPGVDIAPTGSVVRLAAGALCALVTASLVFIVLAPPEPAHSLAPRVMQALPQSGLGNPVAGVLFVYRALDTLLEKVVLLLALLGVWSFASDRAWGGVPGLRVHLQADGTLGFLAQLLPPFGILFGIYMCWIGATHPGGAFQGGAVLAAMWLLVMIAGLKRMPAIDRRSLRLSLIVGPAVFVGIGIAGLLIADGFLAYPPAHAKMVVVAIEVALTLSIAVTLGLLAAGSPEQARPS